MTSVAALDFAFLVKGAFLVEGAFLAIAEPFLGEAGAVLTAGVNNVLGVSTDGSTI